MSYFNKAEIDTTVDIIQRLHAAGIDRSQVGVIALCKQKH